MADTDQPSPLSCTAAAVQPVVEYIIETYHPKLPKGKPFTITREGERITVEFKPRDGREAVLVTIESVEEKT